VDTSAKKIVLNTGIIYLKLLIKLFVGLFTTRIILNALGETDYGIYALVAGVVGMLGVLDLSMSIASMRYIANAIGSGIIENIRKTFNSTLIIHLILAFVVVILMEAGGFLMFKYLLNIPLDKLANARTVYQFMIFTTFFSIISVPYSALLTAHENFLILSLIEIFGAIATFIIALIVSLVNADRLILYGLLIFLNQFLLRVIMQFYCKKKYNESSIQFKRYVDKNIIKQMLSFAGWNIMSAFTGIFSNQLRAVLLNMFFGVKLNTANGITSSLAGQLDQISEGMTNAMKPQVMKSEGEGDRNKMIKLTEVTTKFSVFLFTVVAIPVVIEMPYLLKLWLKNVPEYTVIFSRLLIFNMILEKYTFPITTALQSVGKIKLLTVVTMFLSLAGISTVYLLYSRGLGPASVFYVFFIVSIFKSALRLRLGEKYADLNIKVFLKNVLIQTVPPLILASVFSLIPLFMMEESFVRLIITLSLSLLLSLLFIRLLGLNETELVVIRKLITDLKQKIRRITR
jgi:O-antigen/teichoic acid export membrane protein